MMKGCNKRRNIPRASYIDSTKRIKVWNVIIYIVRGIIFLWFFLSIFS